MTLHYGPRTDEFCDETFEVEEDTMNDKAEKQAIELLERAAKIWPDSLWLFSANGSLLVMRKNDRGECALGDMQGFDTEYVVTSIDIENDGGDF